MARFKLRIEMIPKPLWQQNLRSNVVGLGQGRWQKLSREVRSRLGKCSVCGGKDRLHGHEVWEYTERARSGVAKIVDVNAICTLCHSIQHWGRTSILIAVGVMTRADERKLIKRFMKINGCKSKASFDRHSAKASIEWRLRSKKRWKIDWGIYAPAIAEAKAARDLNRQRLEAAAVRRRNDGELRLQMAMT